jgi:hypothetical protein
MTKMVTALISIITNISTMGRTYRHEKEWGRGPKNTNKRKKGNHTPPAQLTQEDYEDEYAEWDMLELEALDEEYYDRRNRD